MADKHSLNYDVRELKLGASFTNNKASQYHTIKYDFKPASVDVNKMATVSVGIKNEVTVTVPHLAGAGVPQTVFKGNQKSYTKECVLFIDRVTGEITLEKLSSNIQVKKTRQETAQKPRPLTPVTTDFTNTTQRSTSRTRVATNKRVHPIPNNNPGPAGPPVNSQARFNGTSSQKPQVSMVRSPQRVKTSPPQAPWSGGGNSTLASLPMIGFDDSLGAAPAAPPAPAPVAPATHNGYMSGVPATSGASRSAPPPPAPDRASHAAHNAHGAYNAHGAHNSHAAHNVHAAHNSHGAHNAHAPDRSHNSHALAQNVQPQQDDSSSSSSSDSDSDSGSDSDDNDSSAQHSLPNGTASVANPNPALPSDVLNDDLCLSESESSDSD